MIRNVIKGLAVLFVFLAIILMVTVLGSGCKTANESCVSAITTPVVEFGQLSDSAISAANQTIDDYVIPNPVELTAIAEYENNENIVVAKANRTYTNWWLGLAEAIFGSTP
jgi:hypothetical protein